MGNVGDEFNHDFFTCNKVTEEKTFSVTLKTRKCVDGRTSPSTQQSTAGRDGREGRRCLSADHPLTTPGGQQWVNLFFLHFFLKITFWAEGQHLCLISLSTGVCLQIK